MVIGLNVCYLLNVCKWRQFFSFGTNEKKNFLANAFFFLSSPIAILCIHLNHWWWRPDYGYKRFGAFRFVCSFRALLHLQTFAELVFISFKFTFDALLILSVTSPPSLFPIRRRWPVKKLPQIGWNKNGGCRITRALFEYESPVRVPLKRAAWIIVWNYLRPSLFPLALGRCVSQVLAPN